MCKIKYKCLSCHGKASIGVLTCAKCEKFVHYNCSELPPYFIMQQEMFKTEHFCFMCITKKKENKIQIKAIEEEIANQEEDVEDTETESTDDEIDSEKTEKKTMNRENHQLVKNIEEKVTKAKAPADKADSTADESKKQRRAICKFFMYNNCRFIRSFKKM